MRVTCLRCLKTYELEDELVPAGGALVQCTGCQHQFIARRPRQGVPVMQGVAPEKHRPNYIHPAVSALMGRSEGPLSVHFEGPCPELSDEGLERAARWLWLRSARGFAPDGPNFDADWKVAWALAGRGLDAERRLVVLAREASRVFQLNRHSAEMAAFFDHELCRLELEEVLFGHGLGTSSPVARLLLRGACFSPHVDTWWVELAAKQHAIVALGVGREGVTEDTAEGCFALLPDLLASSAPQWLRDRHTVLWPGAPHPPFR